MARTVELIKSGSWRKVRASVRCKKPPRTAKKLQRWHLRDRQHQVSLPQRHHVVVAHNYSNIHTHNIPLSFDSLCSSWQLSGTTWIKRTLYNHKLISLMKLSVTVSSQQMADDNNYKSWHDLVPWAFLHAHLPGLQLVWDSLPEQMEFFPEKSALLTQMLTNVYCKLALFLSLSEPTWSTQNPTSCTMPVPSLILCLEEYCTAKPFSWARRGPSSTAGLSNHCSICMRTLKKREEKAVSCGMQRWGEQQKTPSYTHFKNKTKIAEGADSGT